jgi:hypothetical protein
LSETGGAEGRDEREVEGEHGPRWLRPSPIESDGVFSRARGEIGRSKETVAARRGRRGSAAGQFSKETIFGSGKVNLLGELRSGSVEYPVELDSLLRAGESGGVLRG